ncbi:MAG: bifunctional DNA-formamidopyrimidine glycosylase/DNA-(apurinic or apyrimidinic site) lyase [Phycisphaerae bacterium]|jgi:formamidopyrimidine-DNA glycosylase
MPELPEVESLRRSLEPRLVGRLVRRAQLLRADICSPTPRSARDRAHRLLQNATIASIERRGKQLALVAADGRALIIQLGMSGQVLLLPDPADIAIHTHVHALWTIDRGDTMLFRDPRRFGGLRPLPTRLDLDAVAWNNLGPDALAIQGHQLHQAAASSARSIKSVLLDQSVLAGVGNIYADESLFLARLHPLTPARDLTPRHWDTLAARIRDVLQAAIAQGGSTLRDYVDALGRAGAATNSHRVYGRRDLPCLACGTPLVHTLVSQRSTVSCPRCQPPHPRPQ